MKKISIYESESNAQSGLVALAGNPNCPRELLVNLSRSRDKRLLRALAGNPSCPSFVLSRIVANHNRDKETFWIVINNPNCPSSLVKPHIENLNSGNIEYLDFEYLKSPAAPTDILEWLYENAEDFDEDKYKMGTIELRIWDAINNNPNAPDYIINGRSTKGLMDKIKKNPYYYRGFIDRYIKIATEYENEEFLDFLVKFIEENNTPHVYSESELVKELIKITNAIGNNDIEQIVDMVLRPDCPIEVLYMASLIDFRTPAFEKMVESRISKYKLEFNRNAEKNKTKRTLHFNDYMELRIKDMLNKGSKKYLKGNKIDGPVTNKVLPTDNFGISPDNYRLVIVPEQYSLIEKEAFEKSIGEKYIYYGEYPIKEVSEELKGLLKLMYMFKMLNKTYRNFTICDVDREEVFTEFYLGERKFVQVGNRWYEVLPLLWHLNKERHILEITEHIPHFRLVNGRTFIPSFKKNFAFNPDTVTKEEKREVQKENDKFKEKKRISDDIQKAQNDDNKERLKSEIDGLEKQIQKILILLVQKKSMMGKGAKLHSISITEELLYDEVDGHFEIKSIYLPFLKYLNLQLIDTTNLKVSNIDFRGSNITINPQKVFNKDLSYAKFDDENIRFGNFRGCDLRGTDISHESFFEGLDEAIIDENTKLPSVRLGLC